MNGAYEYKSIVRTFATVGDYTDLHDDVDSNQADHWELYQITWAGPNFSEVLYFRRNVFNIPVDGGPVIAQSEALGVHADGYAEAGGNALIRAEADASGSGYASATSI